MYLIYYATQYVSVRELIINKAKFSDDELQ